MTTGVMRALSAEHRDRLMGYARDVAFPAGTRIFEEGSRADRFWVIRTGTVILDLHIPGRRSPSVEQLGPGELLGWSWLFPPYSFHLGAEALSPVRAVEFDAAAVRRLCKEDPALGYELVLACSEAISHRLTAARNRLLDMYAPHGGGSR